MENLPILEISPEARAPFVRLVDEILELKKRGENTDEQEKDQEKDIDEMVYDLYDLTKAERDIIEGNIETRTR